MIDQIFAFSVTAGAAASNLSPSNFNPVPDDGVLELFGVTDDGAGTLTALPSLQVVLGGTTPGVPVPGSVIPMPQGTGLAANGFPAFGVGPTTRNRLMGRVPVRRGTNMQINVAGGTGQTATGRIRAVFMSTAEAAASIGAPA